jgi:hypothetical protein
VRRCAWSYGRWWHQRKKQTLEVLEDSELLGFNFKDHFGVIWMAGASNNSLAAGKMLESPHDLPDYPQCLYINKSSSFSLSLSRLLFYALRHKALRD